MTDNNKVIDMRETSTDNYEPENQSTENAENQQNEQKKVSLKDKAIAKYKEIGPKKLLLGAVAVVGAMYFGPKVIKAVKTAFTTPSTAPTPVNLAEAPELSQIPENLNDYDLADATAQLCEIGATTADAAAVTEQAQQVQAVANAAETIGSTVETVTTF